MILNDQGLPEQYPFQHGWEITPRGVKEMLGSEDPPLLGALTSDVMVQSGGVKQLDPMWLNTYHQELDYIF